MFLFSVNSGPDGIKLAPMVVTSAKAGIKTYYHEINF